MIKITSSTFSTDSNSRKAATSSLQAVLENKSLGFHQLPERSHLWQSCFDTAKLLRERFQTMVVLGIGGSSLGGKVIKEALFTKADRRLLFCESIDPLEMDFFLNSLSSDLESICWAIISKSGNTIETLTQADYIHQFYAKQNLSWPEHCVIITEPKNSPLGEFADRFKLPRIEVPFDVGGRFSVLSPVGMLPAAFMGLNIDAFRNGASQALSDRDLVSELVAQTEMSFARKEWITLFWAYSQSFNEFGYWLQQLWAESLAKRETRQGQPAPRVSTPLPCLGPADQHSILQQIAEGTKDKFILFFRHRASEEAGDFIQKSLFNCGDIMISKRLGTLLEAEAQATQMGLEQNGVANLSLQVSQLTERELGYLFMLFELVVATLGERLNINAFDQPGVELGKVIAKKLLLEKK